MDKRIFEEGQYVYYSNWGWGWILYGKIRKRWVRNGRVTYKISYYHVREEDIFLTEVEAERRIELMVAEYRNKLYGMIQRKAESRRR